MSSQMSRLWAPWRGEWIENQKDIKSDPQNLCPFCKISKENPTKQNLVLFCDEDIFVVLNKYPYNPAHLMVIPTAHISDPQKLTPKVSNKIAQAITLSMASIEKSYSPQGFNFGLNQGLAGGAGIPQHLHWHILPRWVGDTNFMPLLAEAKALPIHNETIYDRLLPSFEDFAEKLRDAMMRST